jgi:hypothetical protein
MRRKGSRAAWAIARTVLRQVKASFSAGEQLFAFLFKTPQVSQLVGMFQRKPEWFEGVVETENPHRAREISYCS